MLIALAARPLAIYRPHLAGGATVARQRPSEEKKLDANESEMAKRAAGREQGQFN